MLSFVSVFFSFASCGLISAANKFQHFMCDILLALSSLCNRLPASIVLADNT